MYSCNPYKKALFIKELKLKEEAKEDIVYLAGRTILVTSKKHVKADIASARTILQRLLATRVNSSIIEVSSIEEVVSKGGCIR